MKLALEISLLSDHGALFGGSLFALACAFTGAVVAIVFAIAFFTIALAVTAAGAAIQQLAGPGDNTIAVGGNDINDTSDSGQGHNNLGNYFQSFHNKPSIYIWFLYPV
jgi:hypothetical protein